VPDENIEPLILLLVNVHQPVELAQLKQVTVRFRGATKNAAPSTEQDIQAILQRLVAKKLVIQTKGKYAVTLKGLESISKLGLGRLRDKNRLFNLRKAL
jgi:hypothetical protein